jgi:hypothetical protein
MRICEVSEMKRRAMALSSQLDDAYTRLGTGELDGVAEYQRVRDALSRALGNLAEAEATLPTV